MNKYKPSVSERLAVAAVIAPHRRLDDARAVIVATSDEREARVAGVRGERRHRIGRHARTGRVPGNRVANHRLQFVIIH